MYVPRVLVSSWNTSPGKRAFSVNQWQIVTAATKPSLLQQKLTATDSLQSFDKARAWLENCVNTHKNCRPFPAAAPARSPPAGSRSITMPLPALLTATPAAFQAAKSPARLIDLQCFGKGSQDACVFSTKGHLFNYACLSYSWGPSAFRSYVTTSSNFKGNFRILRHGEMPLTIRNAFDICRKLGFRYLWIDAICIVQDSRADWHLEVWNMASIYRNCCLTIAADLSTTVDDGCFTYYSPAMTESLTDQVEIKYHLGEGEMSSLFFCHLKGEPAIKRMIETSPLSDRGWTFQERALSARVLHYTDYQLIWECREVYEAEDGLRLFDSKWGGLRTLCGLVGQEDLHFRKEDYLLRWYTEIAQPYSRRRFSVWTDRKLALTGLIEAMKSKINAAYLGGIWVEMLEFGLCWGRYDIHMADSSLLGPGPSFSWAQVVAPVFWGQFPEECRSKLSLVSLVDFSEGGSAGVNLPRVSCGRQVPMWLKVNGRLKSAKIRLDLSDPEVLGNAKHGGWLDDVLTVQGDYGDEVFGDVTFDNDIVVDQVHCLPLQVGICSDGDEFYYALVLERVTPEFGQSLFGWKRVGLARISNGPRHWRMGSFHTITLL